MKKIFFVAFLFAALAGAWAQRTVTGTVRSADDSKAVPYATMALLRASDSTFVRGTLTDLEGRYSIEVDTFSTLMRVSAIGYETTFVGVDSDATALDVLLNRGATSLDKVVVSGKKPMYAAEGDKKIYNVSEDPTVQNGTAQDALQNTPGVQVDGEGNITLNGKAVKVYINDKESHYTDEMLKQYIKTLTADQISSIEAIEYPSAKYGGGTPVVNIHTRQKMLKNSYLSFGGSGSTEPAFSPFVSYAYATDKFRLQTYLRYSGDRWEGNEDGSGQMLNEDSLAVRDYEYLSSNMSKSHSLGLSISLGYDFDSMNTLSAYIGTWPYWSSDTSRSSYTRYDSVGTQRENYSYTSHSEGDDFWGSMYGSVDFEHKFNNEGHTISFSLGGNLWQSSSSTSSWEHYPFQPQMNFDSRTESRSPDGTVSLGVNYSLPYKENAEFSAGLDFSTSHDKSYYLRDTLGGDRQYHCDYLRSDTSTSPSRDAGLYLSWRRKWGHFTLRLGGNASYAYSSSSHLGMPEYDTAVHNLTFRPSLLLMYNTETMHSFSLNYSNSVSKPSASQLSRYEKYGTDSYSSGNPLLEPSRSHNLGASYSKSFEKGHSLGINASYAWRVNQISYLDMPVYNPFFGRYVAFSQPYNVGNSRNGNIYAYARLRFSALFSMSLNAGLSDDWYSIIVRPGEEPFEDGMTSWNVRLSARAKLFNLVWVSLSGHYNSRSHGWTALQISEPRWGMDMSASADLFDRKLSFYLNVNDIFNTSRWNTTSINPYSPNTSNYTYNSQYVTFGVTLRLGRMELGNSSQEGIQASGGGKGR